MFQHTSGGIHILAFMLGFMRADFLTDTDGHSRPIFKVFSGIKRLSKNSKLHFSEVQRHLQPQKVLCNLLKKLQYLCERTEV